jgi:DeoR family fructose operon transcriptional repressor
MYKIERKSEIVSILEQSGKVDVAELSQRLSASRETIRRDLQEMEEDGILKRTHGGAVFAGSYPGSSIELPVSVREVQHPAEKDAICRKAASLIRDGDNIFLDNSSTCLYLLKYIPPKANVTIITNSVKLLSESVNHLGPNHLVICLGGIFHASNHSLYGNTALKNAADFYPSKMFMSCSGIRPGSVTDTSILEVDLKRMMIERSQEVILLADHSKFTRSGQVFLSDFSGIDMLITDKKATPDQAEFLSGTGTELLVAE